MSDSSKAYIKLPPEWVEDANDMGVSNAEWARRMIRAGRRQWGYDWTEEAEVPHIQADTTPSDPSEEAKVIIKDAILRNLAADEGLSRDEILDLVAQDVERMILESLEKLMDEEEVQNRPSKGGFIRK